VDTTVVDNPAEHRFEIRVDGKLAGFAAYRAGEREHVFIHTEIDPAYEGKGLGSVLIRGALDDVRSRGRAVLPVCPFVRSFVERHPDYLTLVPAAERDRFGLPAAS
jgi:predicted GNAT family acetyltransferase